MEIVVGVDGSGPSRVAVRWAARAAYRHRAELRIMHAYDWAWATSRPDGPAELRHAAHASAERVLTEAALAARAVAPGVPVTRHAVIGAPAPALAGERGPMWVVVGNRGRGGFTGLLLGSVGERVAMHAVRPVVVVRGRAEAVTGPVVAGTGVAWDSAFTEAAARGATLVAIGADADTRPGDLAPWRETYPGVRVEELAAPRDATRMLVEASHTAQLVVVGAAAAGPLVHHGGCPVLVVPR